MLTLKKLKEMKPGIFAKGEIIDSPEGINIDNTGMMLRWVAVRGRIHDWAIYCDFAENPYDFSENSYEYVRDYGNKVTWDYNIKRVVPCDDESFKMYRY